jgi:signal transduction histidine kinase
MTCQVTFLLQAQGRYSAMKKGLAKMVISRKAARAPVTTGAASIGELSAKELPSSDLGGPGRKGSRQQAARKIAHDLQNPISGILAATQYLIEDAGPILADHHLTALRAIESSGFRLLRLIDSLVSVSSSNSRSKRAAKQLRAGSASSGMS